MKRLALACALLFTTVLTAGAADLQGVLTGYTLAAWTQKDGLPAGFITALAQDAEGYLWVGTSAGLFRFDGVRFTPWSDVGTTRLPSASIRALEADPDGTVWVGFSDNGSIARIDGATLRVFGTGEGLSASMVLLLVRDSDRELWAGTSDGLYRLTGEHWNKWDGSRGVPDEPILTGYADKGSLLIGTAKSLLRFDAGAQRFVSIAALNDPPRAIVDLGGSAYLVTDQVAGMRVVGQPLPVSFERSRGRAIIRDRRGNIWLGTAGQGLWRIRLDEQHRVRLAEHATVETGMPSNGASPVFEDREGNIWAGTPEGLTRLTPYKATQITDIGLVTGIDWTSNGTLWVGTADELLEFPAGDLVNPHHHALPGASTLRLIHADSNDTLWVATESSLWRFTDGRFVSIRLSPSSAVPRQLEAMTSDGQGGLWLSDAEKGLLRWSRGALTPVPLSSDETHVLATLTDSGNRAWFALRNGRVAMSSGTELRVFGPKDGLTGGIYNAIYEDASHAIWLAGSAGLTRYADGHFATAHSSISFPISNLTAIAEDDSDHLWLGSTTGIVQIRRDDCERAVDDPSRPVQYRIYDRSDGLAGLPFVYSSNKRVAHSLDGRLWFVTSRGLAVIDPPGLQTATRAPVHIESIGADGVRYQPRSGATLPSGTSRLDVEFTAINLTSPLKQRFRYRLEGFDADWIDAGTRRQAFYTNLPPRQYRFTVMSTDTESVWTQPAAAFEFSIPPRFSQTWWFALICVAGLALAVGGAWRLHLRSVRRQFAMLIGERARLSRELHDTLLQNLVGIALQIDAVANDPKVTPSDAQRREFVRMRKRVEQYIREARQSISDLRSPRLETHDLATALREAGEREIDGRPIQFSFSQNGTPRAFPAMLEEQLLKIGREAIVNAARHSQADRISIELESGDRAVTLRVTDNGTGFDPAAIASDASAHYGLTSMRERAEEVGGRLTVDSSHGRGTRIEATVPLQDGSRGKSHGEHTVH
jgi:signal transduction histidine kinase/ligand-binding sensor domain-containing protein